MSYKTILFFIVIACYTSGCGASIENPLEPQSQVQVSLPKTKQENIALKESAELCKKDTSCRSGLCADPGFGVTVCTFECDLYRPCGKGFSCANGLCVPSCQNDGDCSAFSVLPVCAGGGVCWR